MKIFLPNTEQVIEFHRRIVAATGGSDGLRSEALLESALARAQAGFGDEQLYPTIEEKAAAAGCGLIQNHPFIDGNKRIGVSVLLLILRGNGIMLAYTQEELVALGLGVASGQTDIPQVVHWIHSHRA